MSEIVSQPELGDQVLVDEQAGRVVGLLDGASGFPPLADSLVVELENGDGLAAVQWLLDCTFKECLSHLGEYLHLSNGNGASRPKLSIVEAVARCKKMPLDAFLAYGAAEAKRNGKPSARVPSYGHDGKQCSHFDLFADRSKGKSAAKKPTGVFLPHDNGKPILPTRGETWFVVEGVKDAAAMFGQGHHAIGLPSCRMAKKFTTMFTGVDVLFVPDRDNAGVDGFSQAARLIDGRAASISTVHLPTEMKKAGGDDVRDVLSLTDGAELLKAAIADAEPYAGPDENVGDGGHDENEGEERAKESVATIIVKMATARVSEFWHDDQTAYATLEIDGHAEHHPLRTRGFKSWLARQYHRLCSRVPGSQGVSDAITVLEGLAIHEGREQSVYVRTAEHEERYYIDLGTPDWSAIEVDATGWRINPSPPIAFRRPKALHALPMPLQTDAAEIRCEPKCPQDVAIQASNGHVVALDNLSRIPDWLSDALCRLATGGGFSTRQLFTDGEEAIFDSIRPVILTGICEVATRGDLVDRSLTVALPRMEQDERKTEAEFWQAFDLVAPRILGGLLSAMSSGMAALPTVKIALPRMADFAKWAVACEPAFGRDDFQDAFDQSRRLANDVAVESSAAANAILEMDLVDTYEGTASELLAHLKAVAWDLARDESGDDQLTWPAARPDGWPKGPNMLSGELRRLAPCLRESGVEVEFGREPGGTRRRLIQVSNLQT